MWIPYCKLIQKYPAAAGLRLDDWTLENRFYILGTVQGIM